MVISTNGAIILSLCYPLVFKHSWLEIGSFEPAEEMAGISQRAVATKLDNHCGKKLSLNIDKLQWV